MATALLNLTEYPATLTIKDDNENVITEGIPVRFKQTESVDTGVDRLVRKHGFSVAGEPFDYMAGFGYRLRTRKG